MRDSDLPHDVYDHTIKSFWKRYPLALLGLALPDQPLTVGEAIALEGIRTQKRNVDAALRVTGPSGTFVAHAEFEANADRFVPERTLEYNLLLRFGLEDRPVVRSFVFLLQTPSNVQEGTFEIRYGDTLVLDFRFTVVPVYRLPARMLAEAGVLAVLTPLGSGFSSDAEPLLRRATRTLRQETEPAEGLNLLNLLSRAKGVPKSLVEAIIHSEEVRMAASYQEILQEGRQEGLQEGLQEGRREGQQALLAKALTARFKRKAGPLLPMLAACQPADLEWLLLELLNPAVTVAALQTGLQRRLPAPG